MTKSKYDKKTGTMILRDPYIFDGGTDFSDVKHVMVRRTVKEIPYRAFEGCSKLETISLPDSIRTIDSGAFWGCRRLKSIEIPEGVKLIDSSAFYGCESLKSIKIPASVGCVDYAVFNGCRNLVSIDVDEGNKDYYSEDGVLFSRRGPVLSTYPPGKAGRYVIPDSVKSIENFAFIDCVNLTSIKIPDSVTSIGIHAFKRCRKLKSIRIPASVAWVDGAFFGCTGLKSIIVDNDNERYYSDDGVLYDSARMELNRYPPCKDGDTFRVPSFTDAIGYGAFEGCRKLKSIILPEGVRTIDEEAFRGCTGLESIVLPYTLVSIGMKAFADCTNLRTVTIPDTVRAIDDGAFEGCSSLETINIVKNENPNRWDGGFVGIPEDTKAVFDKGCRSLSKYLTKERRVRGNDCTIYIDAAMRNIP